jgi:D-alanyl-D-alanine carboxypeptidase
VKSLQTWLGNTLGHKTDLDNASFDCVDVSKSWIVYLSGEGWTISAGWGNAKDIYAFWSEKYLSKIPRGNAPQLGDIVVMNGQIGGGYGHTGVVIAIDGRNIQIVQQDTFTQAPANTGWFDGYASYITGYLRPKVEFTTGAAQELQPWQRIAVAEGVYYRKEPKRSGEQVEFFDPNTVIDFKGFVRGEAVDGNDIWFVGRYTGFYSWSGGFKDSGTHDLADLTPAAQPVLADNQRKVGSDAMNVRSSAQIDTVHNNVVKLLQPETVITVKGYVIGQNIDGVDKWFVLDDGNYTWVAGFTNQDISKLPDLTPKAPVEQPQTPQQPQYPAPTQDVLVTAVVNKKQPLSAAYVPSDLVNIGNGQQLRTEAAAAMQLMQAAATAAGAALTMASGYRSYAAQQTLYAQYVIRDGKDEADRYSARAGHSEHQTGLTMDFAPIDELFKNSTQYKWLVGNAHKYGFILRYPEGKEDVTGYMPEPWHWRYVGVTYAAEMKAKGISTLEEYTNTPGGKYADQEVPTTPTVPTDPQTPTDPVTPTNPEVPSPPRPAQPDEAAASATAFVARVTSQLAAAAIVVNGLAGLLQQYAAITFDGKVLGLGTVMVALAIVAYSQYRYKKTGGQKGWIF